MGYLSGLTIPLRVGNTTPVFGNDLIQALCGMAAKFVWTTVK